MSAEAGPGPSTMASSPLVPGSAKHLRIKKRMINIVNPADPDSFSTDHNSMEGGSTLDVRRERETTPIQTVSTPVIGTPSGSEVAKRGILRSQGTPGSGNGVRFFPKNRFRIITPNASHLVPSSPARTTAQSAAATPDKPRRSLLTQLISRAMPSISPEKPIHEETEESLKVDESWEVPGQEGEISLIASSNTSMIIHDDDEEEDEEYVEEETQAQVWDGTPTIHCSPLNLPTGDDSREISHQDLQAEQSNDWGMKIPDDMSNLLHEKWSPTDPSFSISDPPPSSQPAMPLPTRQLSRSPSIRLSTSDSMQTEATPMPRANYREEHGETEEGVSHLATTVRKRASSPRHIDELVPLEPSTPTPMSRPMPSIFAEMSAEQADMSWPLRRPDQEDETAFHSAMINETETSPLSGTPFLPPRRIAPGPSTPRSAGTGDKTAYYDCSDSFAFSPLSLTLPPMPSPTPISAGTDRIVDLARPTNDLFTAQSAHVQALGEEMQLYRDLASKLHNEVLERDTALADLSARLSETETLKGEVANLREELERTKAGPPEMTARNQAKSSRDRSATSPLLDAADRTTVIQAETRDLEIRLSKALSEHRSLRQELDEVSKSRDQDRQQLADARAAVQEAEDRYRDQLIASQHRPVSPVHDDSALRAELQSVQDRCSDLEVQLTRATDSRSTLEVQVTEMRQVKLADEEEIENLNLALDGMRESKRDSEGMRVRLDDAERRLEGEARMRVEMEQYLREERASKKRLEAENKELIKSLQATRLQLAQTPIPAPTKPTQDPALIAEIARLRAESASKDLDIGMLQRRKNELKEDREMLNIALDSKQQELELIKRKYGVHGKNKIGNGNGTTPLGLSNRVNETPGHPILSLNTPAPALTGYTHGKSRRRSSALHERDFITPSLVGGEKRALRSSALLATVATHTGREREGTRENERGQDKADRYGSLRRERMLA